MEQPNIHQWSKYWHGNQNNR